MKKLLTFIFVLAMSLPVLAQECELKIVSWESLPGFVSYGKCPYDQDPYKEDTIYYRARIDIVIPNVEEFKVSSSFLDTSKIDKGPKGHVSVFVPTYNEDGKDIKLKIVADSHEPLDLFYSVDTLEPTHIYKLILKAPCMKKINITKQGYKPESCDSSEISFTMDVKGCRIEIDGVAEDVEGLSYNKSVKNGNHKIKISHSGYLDNVFDYKVDSDNSADLILNIDESNSIVYIDSVSYSVGGNKFEKRLNNGLHHITVSKHNHEDFELDVDLKCKAVQENVNLQDKGGNVLIYVKNGYEGSKIMFTPDSIPKKSKTGSFRIYDSHLSENLLGKYRVHIEDEIPSYKGKVRQKNKTIKVSLGDNIQKTYRFSKIIEKKSFLFGADYCPEHPSLSIQIGGVRRFGFLMDFETSLSPWAFSSPYHFKDLKPLPDNYEQASFNYEDKGTLRMSIHPSFVWRWTHWFGVYAGAGYGCKTQVYVAGNSSYHDGYLKGAEAVGGAFIRTIKPWVNLKVSYVRNFGEVNYNAIRFGILIGGKDEKKK